MYIDFLVANWLLLYSILLGFALVVNPNILGVNCCIYY